MNENKLNPELEKIFDEYSTYFWNRLDDCSQYNIEEAIDVFRDALIDIDKIMKEKEIARLR